MITRGATFSVPKFQSRAFKANLFGRKWYLFQYPFRTGLKIEKQFGALLSWRAPEITSPTGRQV
jgi:hypothetical protein